MPFISKICVVITVAPKKCYINHFHHLSCILMWSVGCLKVFSQIPYFDVKTSLSILVIIPSGVGRCVACRLKALALNFHRMSAALDTLDLFCTWLYSSKGQKGSIKTSRGCGINVLQRKVIGFETVATPSVA